MKLQNKKCFVCFQPDFQLDEGSDKCTQLNLFNRFTKVAVRYSFHIVINFPVFFFFLFLFFFFFAPTDRIYKPLIEKSRDRLDTNSFFTEKMGNVCRS